MVLRTGISKAASVQPYPDQNSNLILKAAIFVTNCSFTGGGAISAIFRNFLIGAAIAGGGAAISQLCIAISH